MPATRVERRLAAILAADMVGYSRLMEADEAGTIARQKAHRAELIDPQVAEHGGRIVKTTGDGLLVEFASVVDAVACAAAVQQAMAEREADVAEERRIRYRVGINVGDIVIDGDDILGDGVNLAARLEGLAEPGGICVSANVYDQVRNKTDLAFDDMGAQTVKNIAEPVRAYAVSLEDDGGGVDTHSAPLERPEKPSIAVLPFDNMSGDPEQEYFSDGISEDIITSLSRMPWFFVIARNSTFTYKGQAHDIKRVARELGVHYVLEGSVRKGGNRVRITAQLIDATTGKHVWAQRYDRDLEDIFAVQDEVTEQIVSAVAPEFLSFEARRAQSKDPAHLDAWDCVMRGRWHLWQIGRENLAEARRYFEQALELMPGGEFGASDLTSVHLWEFLYGWNKMPAESLEAMAKYAKLAVAANDHDPWALSNLAWANLFRRQWDDALAPAERAIELNPSFAPALAAKGLVLDLAHGRTEDGIADILAAMRLSPRDVMTPMWLAALGIAYFNAERYEDSAETARRATQLAPDFPTGHRQLAASLAMLGRMEEAEAARRDLEALIPGHTAAEVRQRLPVRDAANLERFVDGLIKAGLPPG
jgi:TolB-like protein